MLTCVNAKPYRPRVEEKEYVARPVDDPARPWLVLRPYETTKAWNERMSRTCYRCGREIADKDALDRHEAAH